MKGTGASATRASGSTGNEKGAVEVRAEEASWLPFFDRGILMRRSLGFWTQANKVWEPHFRIDVTIKFFVLPELPNVQRLEEIARGN